MNLAQVHARIGGSWCGESGFWRPPDDVELVTVLPHQFDPVGFKVEFYAQYQAFTARPIGRINRPAFRKAQSLPTTVVQTCTVPCKRTIWIRSCVRLR